MTTLAQRTPVSRCASGVNPLAPGLPVVGQGTLAGVRKSKRGPWRAVVLIGVHAVIAAHIAHYLYNGRTLSPVEPSESMYTLELGWLNAGFIFFAASILATIVFGRFFCGWGCHIVALQDLCAWMMKKIGVRPRQFRSRLLGYAPLVLALYMFVWPTFRRLVLDASSAPFPGFTNHLMTSSFWATFPGPLFATLTFLTCGFAAVYFLGAKGFCSYGCPYGAVFGAVDRLAPFTIIVSDACDQCGHCTATCTSNVRVHEEVRVYGRVVDPGCMKCTDCVSVCPKEALRVGFAKPSLFAKARAKAAPRALSFDLGFPEEVLVAGVAGVATLAFRGLYDGPPLLMAVGLGGVTGFLTLQLVRCVRRPDVTIQNVAIRRGGRLTASGRVFAGATAVWLLFTAHSAFVQWERARGVRWLAQTEASRADVLGNALRGKTYSLRHDRAAQQTLRHFALADRWGLAGVVEVKLGLAWAHLLHDDLAAAQRQMREAIALAPQRTDLLEDLSVILESRGKTGEAADALAEKLALAPGGNDQRFRLATLLADAGRLEESTVQLQRVVFDDPASAAARYNLGGALRRLGRNDDAIEQLSEAVKLAPADADAAVELGLAYGAAGRRDEAIRELRRAIALRPDHPESTQHLPGLIRELESRAEGS